MKTCRKCHAAKPLTEFHRHPGSRDGHFPSCMECERKRALARYYANREAIMAKTRTPEFRLARKLRGAV